MNLSKASKRRLRLYETQDGKCFYCGRPVTFNKFTTEHGTPRMRIRLYGLKQTLIVGACQTCNNEKGAMTIEEFLRTGYLSEERRQAVMQAIGKSVLTLNDLRNYENTTR